MNTFTIYENYSIVFNRVCYSPLSLEDKTIILTFLEKHKFTSLGYSIDIIYGNNHQRVTGLFYSADKFFHYFEDLCKKESIKYGVVMYLN